MMFITFGVLALVGTIYRLLNRAGIVNSIPRSPALWAIILTILLVALGIMLNTVVVSTDPVSFLVRLIGVPVFGIVMASAVANHMLSKHVN